MFAISFIELAQGFLTLSRYSTGQRGYAPFSLQRSSNAFTTPSGSTILLGEVCRLMKSRRRDPRTAASGVSTRLFPSPCRLDTIFSGGVTLSSLWAFLGRLIAKTMNHFTASLQRRSEKSPRQIYSREVKIRLRLTQFWQPWLNYVSTIGL
jgi:hypothetical protein